MSGRIRTLKPELMEDALAAGLSDTAFRLFVGMVLMADDHGGLRAEAALLKSKIWWRRDPSSPVAEAITELGRFVQFYVAEGQCYAQIRNWEKHQRVDKPGKRRTPDPPAQVDSRESRDTVDKILESLVPDLRSPIPIPITDPEQTRTVLDASEPEPSSPTDASAVRHVFDHWVQGWARTVGGKRKPIQNAKRTKAIRARLNEGRTAEELCHAIDGLWRSDFHVRGGHTDIELVCRDDAHVLRFIAIADGRVNDLPRNRLPVQRAPVTGSLYAPETEF